MRTIKNPYDTSIICFQHSCSVFFIVIVYTLERMLEVGIEETYGCAGFRGELRIHIISHMICVVVLVNHRIIARIANIRHGIWMRMNYGDCSDQVRES